MIAWPSDLIEDLAARRCVLFLGAGVSKNSKNARNERPKDWNEYLLSLAQEIADPGERAEVEQCVKNNELLTACELAKGYVRADRFKSHLLAEFNERRFEHAEIHDSISAIDARYVLTTNFDRLYETRANTLQQNTVLVKNYYDSDVADVFRRKHRVVLKIHGSIDHVDKVIFTRSSYAAARIEYAHFYRLLDTLFTTHTFVFLGASMRDPDLQLVMEDHAYRFEGTRPHFIVMPEGQVSPAVLRVMERSMNLRSLLYDPQNGHEELSASLKTLAPIVMEARAELSVTQNW
jgi:hypothetical protein